jgi:hypothetical protein
MPGALRAQVIPATVHSPVSAMLGIGSPSIQIATPVALGEERQWQRADASGVRVMSTTPLCSSVCPCR